MSALHEFPSSPSCSSSFSFSNHSSASELRSNPSFTLYAAEDGTDQLMASINLHEDAKESVEEVLSDWDEWLRRYADGQWTTDGVPSLPDVIVNAKPASGVAIPARTAYPPSPEPSPPLEEDDADSAPGSSMMSCSSSVSFSSHSNAYPPTSPQDILAFYNEFGYLPAPECHYQNERLQLMRRYSLDEQTRKDTVDRVCRIAKNAFGTRIVIISLVFDTHQSLAAETGWDAVDPLPDAVPRQLPWNSAFCAHGMTIQDSNKVFLIEDASKDWRFAKNPYALQQGGPLAFYASANIHLPSSSLHSNPPTARDLSLPPTLPVGSLCVIDDKPRTFSNGDRKLLRDLADMVAREFQLAFEQARRTTEAQQTKFVADFLTSALVFPRNEGAPTSSPASAPATSAMQTDDISHPRFHAFQDTAKALREFTNADSAGILDLRSFRAPLATFKDRVGNHGDWDGRWGNAFAECRLGDGKIFHMGSAGTVDWERLADDQELPGTVTAALKSYYSSGITEFDALSGACELLPILPPDTTATCAIPVCDVDGTPALLIVLTSSERHFTFEPADSRFVTSVGAIIVGSLLRQRALESDRAKLAFVSQISHELRSPLFGINSQIELIREFSTPTQLARLEPFLDVADVCLESLRDVLDDVLDFGKVTNTRDGGAKRPRPLVKSDLEVLVSDVAKATWVRKQRVDRVSADIQGKPVAAGEGKVDVILETQAGQRSWMTFLDVGGMKRVLLNLLGNALKFTKNGHIKIRLQELPITESGDMTPTGQRLVAIDVEDTGCGIGEDFIRDGKLFTPFLQENPFSNGAGLGMSIVDSIVSRMGGKLDVVSKPGVGTTIRVTVPLTFTTPAPASSHGVGVDSSPDSHYFNSNNSRPSSSSGVQPVTFRRKIISDELGTLLSTPGVEKPAFDFEESISMDDPPFVPKFPATALPNGRPFELALPQPGSRLRKEIQTITPDPSPPLEMAVEPIIQMSPRSEPSTPLADLATPTAANFRDGMFSAKDYASPKVAEASLASVPESMAPDVSVLVVDDNVLSRNIVTKLMQGKGIAFQQGCDGQDAVELYKQHQFNLCFFDLQMPVKDGLQAAREIRIWEKQKNLPRCRIIILSGISNDEDRAQALGPLGAIEIGPVDGWITKGGKSLRVLLSEIKSVQATLLC